MQKPSNLGGALLHILVYLRNKSMEYSDFWNTYQTINYILFDTLFDFTLLV